MVGAAAARRLKSGHCELLTPSYAALDLTRQADVESWMAANKPDVVVLAAAKVGGIAANSAYPADFLYENMMIEANVIHAAYKSGVEKLLFLGSSCIYPREAEQPIKPEALLSGSLEPTNEAYAVAKIAGLKLCEAYRKQEGCDFISAMPCNLYGPGDTYDEQNSHVIPALLMRAVKAKKDGAEELVIWGTGAPLREFLYVDDLADGLIFLLKHYSGLSHVNIGSGEEVSIKALAVLICELVGYEGALVFDETKPDGTPKKVIDSSVMTGRGWRPKLSLSVGLQHTLENFNSTFETSRIGFCKN